MQLIRAIASKFYIKENEDTKLSQTYCYVQSSYFGNLGNDEWEKDIPVFLPAGMSLIFDEENDDKIIVEGMLLYLNEKFYFLFASDTLNTFEQVHGTSIYDIQNFNTRITLDKNTILLQTPKSKIVLADDEPAIIEINGVNILDLFEGLLAEVKSLITTGSPAMQTVNEVSKQKLDLFFSTKVKKVFKKGE